MDVAEVLLPGVGVRYELTTEAGHRIGLVVRRGGDVDVVGYGPDPDVAVPMFHLTAEEAETVAELLGGPRVAERLADLTREIPGLEAGQVLVGASSPYVDRPLVDTRARTVTGASVVAVVRGEEVLASPGPGETLRAGDVLVVIGTREGITAVERIVGG